MKTIMKGFWGQQHSDSARTLPNKSKIIPMKREIQNAFDTFKGKCPQWRCQVLKSQLSTPVRDIIKGMGNGDLQRTDSLKYTN